MNAEEFNRARRRVWREYEASERERAGRWKENSASLPEEARRPGTYGSGSVEYAFCLPLTHSQNNLLPPVREMALALFADKDIAWHKGVNGGPTNHLVSSQVQCVNALGHLVDDEERLRLAFGSVIDIGQVLPIEDDRLLTFEYVGPRDFRGLEEGRLSRGANSTSVDAAFLHQHPVRGRELVLVEWKYTERYGGRPPLKNTSPGDPTRAKRYMPLVASPRSPVRADLLSMTDLFTEPFFQLMRQQLLAAALEGRFVREGIPAPVPVVDSAVVVHVTPSANAAYQHSLSTAAQLSVGSTVGDVWQTLLRDHDRFKSLDSEVFLDPAVTSAAYVERYGS